MTNNTASADDSAAPTTSKTVLYETRPSFRPAVVKLSLAVVAGASVIIYLLTYPRVLGSQQNTEIGTYVLVLVVLLLLVRYAVRIYLLKRYRYTVTEEGVRWEYSLFYKTRSRELPFTKIRGHEFRQDRIQSLFGFGTVSILSGGTNHSLGFIRFENVADPGEIQSTIRDQINN